MKISKYKYSSIYTILPAVSICRYNFFTEIHIEFWKYVIIINLGRDKYKPLILNNMNDEDKALKEEAVKKTMYKVDFVLNEKFWNEGLKKYLFSLDRGRSPIVVSDTNALSLELEDIWQITDGLYEDKFESLTITKIK